MLIGHYFRSNASQYFTDKLTRGGGEGFHSSQLGTWYPNLYLWYENKSFTLANDDEWPYHQLLPPVGYTDQKRIFDDN